jgi:serine/threonine protein kinase
MRGVRPMENQVQPLAPRTVVSDYTVECALGQGGFGTTYLCRDNNLQRQCVLKEFTPHEIVTRGRNGQIKPKSWGHRKDFENALKSFLSEAQKLARFNHPNIVRINRYFAEKGTGYFVMDYEQGVALRSLILESQGRLEEREIEALLLPLCDGLRTLHDQGLIHRDIKPDNILVRPDGSPVLIDFGAAIDLSTVRTGEFYVIATPRYAPVEQFDPRFPQGPWIDIYALSATIYELVSGQPPPQAATRLREQDAMRPAQDVGRGRYGDRLLGLIDQGLAVDFRERPRSMEDFISSLRVDNNVYLRKVIVGISEKATQHFLNWAKPNDGLYFDEFVAFTIGFPIIDLCWRIGKGTASKEMFLSVYRSLDHDSLEYCGGLMFKAGFRVQRTALTLSMVEGRVEEYASTYLLDRQSEDWTYEFTRRQCARNCLTPGAKGDTEGFEALMEDVIDRARGRVKKEFNKAFRRVEWYRVGNGWRKRIKTKTE